MIYTIEEQIKAVNLARKQAPPDLAIILNDAANTLESVRLIGVARVMHAKEMYELISSMGGSGWLNETPEGWHLKANKTREVIDKYKYDHDHLH